MHSWQVIDQVMIQFLKMGQTNDPRRLVHGVDQPPTNERNDPLGQGLLDSRQVVRQVPVQGKKWEIFICKSRRMDVLKTAKASHAVSVVFCCQQKNICRGVFYDQLCD